MLEIQTPPLCLMIPSSFHDLTLYISISLSKSSVDMVLVAWISDFGKEDKLLWPMSSWEHMVNTSTLLKGSLRLSFTFKLNFDFWQYGVGVVGSVLDTKTPSECQHDEWVIYSSRECTLIFGCYFLFLRTKTIFQNSVSKHIFFFF